MIKYKGLSRCPFCGSNNVYVCESGRYRVLHCSDCEENYELHKALPKVPAPPVNLISDIENATHPSE